MSNFNNFFSENALDRSPQYYATVCYEAATILRNKNLVNFESEDLKIGNSIIKKEIGDEFESLIITFFLIVHRLRELEEIDMDLISYLGEHNSIIKESFNIIIDGLKDVPELQNVFKEFVYRPFKNDIRSNLMLYFFDRIFYYENYILGLLENDDPKERILYGIQVSKIYNTPFTKFFDVKLVRANNFFILSDKEIDSLKAETKPFISAIHKSYDYIKIIINN